MVREKCRTAAQQHGYNMRAKGRTYRGGYTRDELKAKKSSQEEG